ncbi:MAG: TVP38/TMEM64 family protein [Sarcina sp.]
MKSKKWRSYIKYGLITIVIVIILGVIIFNLDKVLAILNNTTEMKKFVLGHKILSIFIFIIVQILQIVIFFIPGEVVQLASGYIFGPYISFVLCIIGVVIGSFITFCISRRFGKPFVEKIINKDSLWIVKKLDDAKHHRDEKYPGKIRKKHPKTIIFILYMIPGIPKDILGYISGIADISLKEFLIISTIARSPALFLSCFFGDKLEKIKDRILEQGAILNIIIILLVVILIILFIVISKKIIKKMKEDVDG